MWTVLSDISLNVTSDIHIAHTNSSTNAHRHAYIYLSFLNILEIALRNNVIDKKYNFAYGFRIRKCR